MTPHDPADRRSFSGTAFSVARALERAGLAVEWIGPKPKVHRGLGRLVERAHGAMQRFSGETYFSSGWQQFLADTRRDALELDARLQQGRFRGVVGLVASPTLAFLRTDIPVIHVSDAVFVEISAIYPEFAGLSSGMRALLDDCEHKALVRAARCCFSSEWAAAGAVRRYGIVPAKVLVVPFGPNIEGDRPFVVRRRARGESLRLLFLARGGWERKAGPIAVKIAENLREMGEDCHLTVLGMKVPQLARTRGVESIGYLDKNDPKQQQVLRSIFDRSHLLLLASAADASPMVLAEAACLGLPAVTREVGGIPTLVEHNASGLILPRDADASAFANAIFAMTRDEGALSRMSRAARARFESTLNWTSWARGILAALDEVAVPSRGASPSA